MALDLNELNKNKKSVIRYSDKKERTLAPFESNPIEIGKKTVPESNTEKALKRFDKLEAKTGKLLEKAQKIEERTIANKQLKDSPTIANTSPKHSRIKRRASYIEFLCLKGIKKEILNTIKESAYEENGEWFGLIDTEKVQDKTKSKPSIIRDALYRMKEEEWYEVVHFSFTGIRLVKINPKNFGL